MSRDAQASCRLVPPFILNNHTHRFGISKQTYHCYINSVTQLLVSIIRTISHNFQFNSNTEGFLSKYLFETAHIASSSTDVGALKFRLLQFDTFYCGQIQQDSLECLMVLIKVISKCSIRYCISNDNNSTGFSPSKILFSVKLEKCVFCDVCGPISPLLWI